VKARQASGSFFEEFWAARFRLRGCAAASSGRQEPKKLLIPLGDSRVTSIAHLSRNFLRRFFLKKRPLACLAFLPSLALAAPQSAAAVAAAVRQAAFAVAPPNATISLGPVTGAAYMQACTMQLAVSISGVAPYEQAAAHCSSPAWTLYVTVTVAARLPVVVAAHALLPGQPLGPADLRLALTPVALFAGRAVYTDPAPLIGTIPLIGVAPGGIIAQSDIEQPVVVQAGQTVEVTVVSGAVSVSVTAVADETGRVGDTILLTNQASGRRFTAFVTAAGPQVTLP